MKKHATCKPQVYRVSSVSATMVSDVSYTLRVSVALDHDSRNRLSFTVRTAADVASSRIAQYPILVPWSTSSVLFDSHVAFQKVSTQPPYPSEKFLVDKTIFRFTTVKGNRYMVHIHQYHFCIYVVKFHLRCYKKHGDRYLKVSNLHEAPLVIRTVVNICLSILKRNPDASFGFMGAPKVSNRIDKCEDPAMPNNQRFRIYKRLMGSLFGTQLFDHLESAPANCYLLLNKQRQRPPLEEVLAMFRDVFHAPVYPPVSID